MSAPTEIAATLADNPEIVHSPALESTGHSTETELQPNQDSQVNGIIEHDLAFMDARSNLAPDNYCSIASNKVELPSFDISENALFEKQVVHEPSLSLGTISISDVSSEGGYESSDSTKRYAKECEPHDAHESTINDASKKSMGASDVHDDGSLENASEVLEKRNILSWKEPNVDKSEIPSSVLKPPSSDITDLGDREFYANMNAMGRAASTSIALDEGLEPLALQDRYFEALVRVDDQKKGFFPRALLSTLVTEECVFQELSSHLNNTHNQSQIQTYAKRICEELPLPKEDDDNRPPKIQSFKKIFAILVLIEKTPSISKFLEENVNDLHLPLVKVPKGKNGSRFELRLSHMQEKPLECFRNWTQFSIRAFEENQWTTIAPFFYKGSNKEVKHFPLSDSVMLPFTSDSRRDKTNEFPTEIEGGYSRVFKVDIHPDHHSFDLSNLRSQNFAIKRLNSQNKEDFKQEVEMLKMFSSGADLHLITLLATYEQFGAYFLIFPWAEGDLNVYWSTIKPKPSFDIETINWVAKQCEGIAYGLAKIHGFRTSNSIGLTGSHRQRYGRHGDLKPENILWFSNAEGGILKISDFGLSEYSMSHSQAYRPKSRVATSMSYRPPECDLTGGQVGQSYDIWTLGCLYLEFITWLLGGWKLVKEFERMRVSFDPMWYDMNTDTFFELVECSNNKSRGKFAARVKPAVTDFMQYLHAHECCTEFLHDFINMIQLDMLIIKPNNPKERGRITCEEVHVKLAGFLKKFNDPDYVFKPAPWSNRSQTSDEVVQIDITDSTAELLHRKRFRYYEGPLQES